MSLILLVIFGLFTYVGLRLSSGIGTVATIALMVLLFAGVAFYRRLHTLKSPLLRRSLLTAVHLEMAFLSFLFAFILIRDLIFGAASFWRPEWSAAAFGREGTLLVLGSSILALIFGVVIARLGPGVIRVSIPIRDLPTVFHGFTIAQISDLHVGPSTSLKFVERVVARTMELAPSMVALTGDIGDGDLGESYPVLKPLSKLSEAEAGAFYVPGNHEYYWDGPKWIAAFQAHGLKPLLNSHAVVARDKKSLLVAGVVDPAAEMAKRGHKPDAKEALVSSPEEAYPRILLAHQPGIAAEAAALGYDLQLSGHTHAGQFFPWTLVIRHVHEFSKGLGRKARMWVYVNQGTGSWGPPVRLGSKTEITLLTLVPES